MRFARLACRLLDHRAPREHPPERRWATCTRCGELFDAAAQAQRGADEQNFGM